MAIQSRRGKYADFDRSKLKPGEWAVVLEGDSTAPDGKVVYMCFAAGVVKRMATYEDMKEQFGDMTDEIIAKLTNEVDEAVDTANSAAAHANTAAEKAQGQAQAAEEAVNLANNTVEDLITRRDSGEFTGPPGSQGPQGAQGESGVMVPASGMFSLYLDPQTGNLYAEYPDGSSPPQFEYDSETGNLYFVTDEGGD